MTADLIGIRVVAAFACGSLLAACASDVGSTREVAFRPGFLVVSPRSVVLVPGEAVQLHTSTLDGVVGGDDAPGVQWNSRDSDVASVDADGRVTATGVGQTDVVAQDGKHGDERVVVDVVGASTDVPQGTYNVLFDPPAANLAIGETLVVSVAATLADGAPASLAGATFSVEPPGAAVVSSTAAGVTVVALSAGLAMVTAQMTNATTGTLPLLIRAAGTGGAEARDCDNLEVEDYIVDGCYFTNGGTARVFNKPGASRDVSVAVVLSPPMECPYMTPWLFGTQAPDEMRFQTPGVVSYDATSGKLTAESPGGTSYTYWVRDTQCNPSERAVRVGVDPGGTWSVTGANGDTGAVTIPAVREQSLGGATIGGYSGGILQPQGGSSCVSNTAEQFSCDGAGSAYSNGMEVLDDNQLCSDATPCIANAGIVGYAAFSLGTCAGARMGTAPGTFVHGNDRVTQGMYEFARGGNGKCDESEPVAVRTCEDGVYNIVESSFTCAGTQVPGLQFSITVSNGTVDGERLTDCAIRTAAECGSSTEIVLRPGGVCQIAGSNPDCCQSIPCTVTKL